MNNKRTLFIIIGATAICSLAAGLGLNHYINHDESKVLVTIHELECLVEPKEVVDEDSEELLKLCDEQYADGNFGEVAEHKIICSTDMPFAHSFKTENHSAKLSLVVGEGTIHFNVGADKASTVYHSLSHSSNYVLGQTKLHMPIIQQQASSGGGTIIRFWAVTVEPQDPLTYEQLIKRVFHDGGT